MSMAKCLYTEDEIDTRLIDFLLTLDHDNDFDAYVNLENAVEAQKTRHRGYEDGYMLAYIDNAIISLDDSFTMVYDSYGNVQHKPYAIAPDYSDIVNVYKADIDNKFVSPTGRVAILDECGYIIEIVTGKTAEDMRHEMNAACARLKNSIDNEQYM